MLNISLEHYVYVLYILLIGAASTCIYVIYSLKGSDLPVNSIKLFQAYFIIGIIGWIFLAIKDLTDSPLDLSLSATSYIFASFILFLAVAECTRKKIMTWLITVANLVVIIFCWLATEDRSILIILSIYALLIYPPVFLISVKRAIKHENIGNGIIAFAIFVTLAAATLQLSEIIYNNNLDFAYSIIMSAAAVGFVMVGIGFLTSILINEHQLLTSLALKDPLTGLLNRRGLDYELRVVLAAAKRNQSCISVIVIDIDFFKNINDTYGHDGGDAVLQEIAKTLLDSLRESDVCCRLGGEEFVLILPDTHIKPATDIAERIRQTIENTTINWNEKEISLTSSFGVSSDCENINIDQSIKNADKALYLAKAEGRNCVRQAL